MLTITLSTMVKLRGDDHAMTLGAFFDINSDGFTDSDRAHIIDSLAKWGACALGGGAQPEEILDNVSGHYAASAN